MAENRYVEVTVTRQTTAVSRAGFSTALMLGTSKASAFKEYSASSALAGVSADFGADSAEYKAVNRILGQTPRPNRIYTLGVAYTDDVAVLTAALDALGPLKDEFFWVTCSNHTVPVITAVSNWTQTQEKVYVSTSTKTDFSDTIPNSNTAIFCHDKADSMLGEGVVGRISPLQPGTYTGTFKQINGEVPASYDDTQISDIHRKNSNTYIRVGGVNMTSASKTLSGEYLDVIVASLYVQARFRESLFYMLVNNDKVPFDYVGSSMVYDSLASTIQSFPNGLLATNAAGQRQFAITVPDPSTIGPEVEATRIFEGSTVLLSLGGAMEGITLAVTLTYDDVETAA